MTAFQHLLTNATKTANTTARTAKRVLLGALLLGGAALASTYDYYLDRLDDFENAGYSEVFNHSSGALDQDESTAWTFTANANYRYAVFAVCDDDCDDLDLKVYDERNNLVGRDVALDDQPFVSFNVRRTQKYRVVVEMAGCSVDPCTYNLGYVRR